jgi:hypothetical protein
VQKSPPALPTFIITRASSPIAAPTASKSGASKVEATPMISGKEVADGVGGRKLTDGDSHTPCSASPHHSYAGTPSRATAGTVFEPTCVSQVGISVRGANGGSQRGLVSARVH